MPAYPCILLFPSSEASGFDLPPQAVRMRGEVIRIADALRALIPASIFKPPISDASPPSRGAMRPSCA